MFNFETLLKGYPNKYLVEFILHGFRHGFNLGFRGTINEQPLRNNKSARDMPDKVSAAIAKEVHAFFFISNAFFQLRLGCCLAKSQIF